MHGFIFGVLFHLYLTPNADIGLYLADASKLASGLLPYRDFTLEYPPLSLIFFGLPRVITSSDALYTKVFQFELLVFDIIGLVLIFDIARRLGEAPWKALSIYTLAVLAVGPIIIQTFDIIPAVMTLAAIYLFWLEKHNASWAVLALGTLTKIYPIVIAPIFFIIYFKNRQFKQMRNGAVTFLAVCLITILPFIILGSGSILNLVSY
ncbi:MAG TPA: glycosyltransferase 87 family protein, partial [Candidatus Bathyarchaeia archaeon]|nr:glycosyltransferase 87 family protein [Candidatus Bathyarchaeia archaeon]